MDENTKEYVDLIDLMLKDERFGTDAGFLSSVKNTILRKKKVSPGQINSIEKIHAKHR